MLFTLENVQFDVIHAVVYDEFAIVQMDDQGIYIVIRPEIDGDEATFSCCDFDIGDGFTDFLVFDQATQQIERWALLPTEKENSYILTIALTQDGKAMITQYSVDYQVMEQKGVFKYISGPNEVPIPVGAMTDVDANQQIIAVACESCNNGYGEILIYDIVLGELLPHRVRGDPLDNKKIGKSVIVQEDSVSGGNRIWYTTEDSISVATLVTYEE